MISKQTQQLERRKYPRIGLNQPVRYTWYSFSNGDIMSPREYWGLIKDLGPEGFCLITLDPPPQDVLMKIDLCIPEDNTRLEICAGVKWMKQNADDNYEIGMKIFVANDKKISHLLNSNPCSKR